MTAVCQKSVTLHRDKPNTSLLAVSETSKTKHESLIIIAKSLRSLENS